MAERFDLQHLEPQLQVVAKEKINEMAVAAARKEILAKYPKASEKIADLIIELGMVDERIAEKIAERNVRQNEATAEHNAPLEKEVSDLNKELGALIAREDEISASIKDIWMDQPGAYPELHKFVENLRDIAHEATMELYEKFGDN